MQRSGASSWRMCVVTCSGHRDILMAVMPCCWLWSAGCGTQSSDLCRCDTNGFQHQVQCLGSRFDQLHIIAHNDKTFLCPGTRVNKSHGKLILFNMRLRRVANTYTTHPGFRWNACNKRTWASRGESAPRVSAPIARRQQMHPYLSPQTCEMSNVVKTSQVEA